jgi:SP family myo-inositol transporter-like MFS transporter 13
MLLFVTGYALGAGNIPWQQGELFRLEVRGVGTSICTAVNWYVFLFLLPFPKLEADIRSSNLIVGATFLSLMRIASPAGAFAIYAIFCVGSWVFCWFCYPETSG